MPSKFGVVPTLAILDKDITNPEFRILALLCTYADRNGECYPKQTTMADALGMARENINRHISKLKDKGWVKAVDRFREDGSQRSSVYQIMHDRHTPCDAGRHTPLPPERHTNNTPLEHTTNEKKEPVIHEWDEDAFGMWWAVYPKQVKKPDARAAYMRALKKTDPATLLRSVEKYAKDLGDPKFAMLPGNWLREECWEELSQERLRYLVDGEEILMTPEHAKLMPGAYLLESKNGNRGT